MRIDLPLAFTILVLLAATHASVKADQLESEYLRRLNRARVSEIEGVRARFERIRMLRLACGLQMRGRELPLSCFAAEKEENAWQMRAPPARRALLSRLDVTCAEAARALRVPPKWVAGLDSLSPNCRAHLHEAWKIQAYRDNGKSWSGN